MLEVAQGFLPEKYRSIMEPRKWSDGMCFEGLAGAPIRISGMHRGGAIRPGSLQMPEHLPT